MFSGHASRRRLSAIMRSWRPFCSGCADTRGGSIPYDRPLAAPDEVKFQTLESNYKIAPMDKLAIKVFKMDDLSGDYDVDLAGNISLPLIGQIEAANLTTAQLDDQLTQKLGSKYLEHPDVSVAIKSSTAHVVTVDGAVKEGGSFPVGGPISLIQAVAMAKGTSEDANARRVAVFRTIGGQAPGGGVRPDLDPPRRSARPANLSRRHRRRRRLVDQGGAEADLPEHSRSCRSSGRSSAGQGKPTERTPVNTNIAVRNEGQWPIAPLSCRTIEPRPRPAHLFGGGDPRFSDAASDHPPLALAGAAARSGVGSRRRDPRSLLTKPVYRAWVTLEANPPSVAVSDEQSRQQDIQATQHLRLRRNPGRAARQPSGRRAHRAGTEPRQ